MLFLFELPEGQDRLLEYGSPDPIEKGTPKVLHEISLRVMLKANKRYAIIPSPRKAGTLGRFTLSVYTDRAQHEFDVKRIDDPSCRCKYLKVYFNHRLFWTDNFILEEYEKNERRIPKWKIKWCQDNLKYMIGKDDEAMPDMSASNTLNKSMKSTRKKSTKRIGAKDAKELSRITANLADVVDDGEDEEDCNMD